MKRICRLTALFNLLVITSAAFAQASTADKKPADSQYRLVWSDEFNNAGESDPANWGYERGFVRNEEFQSYRPENAHCEDGKLIIEARRERFENPRYEEGGRDWRVSRRYAEYTS